MEDQNPKVSKHSSDDVTNLQPLTPVLGPKDKKFNKQASKFGGSDNSEDIDDELEPKLRPDSAVLNRINLRSKFLKEE